MDKTNSLTKWVYNFGDGAAEGDAGDRNLLGGKGANLAQMCHLGLPVPPGFTITTQVCHWYYSHEKSYPKDLAAQVEQAVEQVGCLVERRFGDVGRPLLLSVRSGARASMPGMMDTVLNLGLNDETVAAIAAQAGERFAYDSYRRFIQMYGNVVLGVDHGVFEELLEEAIATIPTCRPTNGKNSLKAINRPWKKQPVPPFHKIAKPNFGAR